MGNHQHDTELYRLIDSAWKYCEKYTGRTFIQTQYLYKFSKFPAILNGQSFIQLPKPPLISVQSISYTDANSSPTTQILDTSYYTVDAGVEPGVVSLNHDYQWPDSRDHYNDITVAYTAGYAPGTDSPVDYDQNVQEDLKTGIKMTVADLFLHRESRNEMRTYQNDFIENFLEQYVIRPWVI